jgi:integrase
MRVPSYRKHSSGQARVTINGRDYLLGKHGTKESKAEYNRLVAEFISSNCSPTFGQAIPSITIRDVLAAFTLHAQDYYPQGDEFRNFKLAMSPMRELYADLPAASFGPIQFEAVRNRWLTTGDRSRSTINKYMKRVVMIVKWAVGRGLMPSSVHETLKCIAPLKYGRCDARETEPIAPVDSKIVEATLHHLPPTVADMVRLQLLVGCRPSELCGIKPRMVDRSSEVWTIKLDKHKTAYRGKSRVIYVGPKAQKVLAKYLLREADSYCFSPAESEAKRHRNRERTTPLNCGNRKGYSERTRKGNKPQKSAIVVQLQELVIKQRWNNGLRIAYVIQPQQ